MKTWKDMNQSQYWLHTSILISENYTPLIIEMQAQIFQAYNKFTYD